MKKILLLLLSVPLILSCSSHDDTEGGRGGLKLKSERTTIESFNQEGNSVIKEIYQEYYYGSNGFVEKIKIITSIDGDSVETYENFIYAGNEVVQRRYNDKEYGGVIDSFIYENGMIVKAIKDFAFGPYTRYYSYDSSNNLVLEEDYNSFGYLISLKECEYKDGNVKKLYETYYSSWGRNAFTYEYDNKHVPVENSFPEAYKKIRRDNKNNVTQLRHQIIEYEYNAQGYPIKKNNVDANIISIYEYY